MAALKRGLVEKTQTAAHEASKPETARTVAAPAWGDTDYADALAMLEDPEIDEETRKELGRGVNAFSRANPELAASVATPELSHLSRSGSSLEATQQTKKRMRAEGYDAIRSPEEYRSKKTALEEHLQEKSELAKESKLRQRPMGETTMPDEMGAELGDDVVAFEEENPDLKVGNTQGQVLFGDDDQPYAADSLTEMMAQIDREAEEAKEATGIYVRNEDLASASKREDLYAPPEKMPEGGGFADYAQARYYYEPSVEMAREALRHKIGSDAANALTESSPEYQRFADALWQETYESADGPIVRVKYMNDENWRRESKTESRKGWEYQARALGVAHPIATGVDRALTFGAASELASGAIETDQGRRARQAHTEQNPGKVMAGALAGSLAPGGLTGAIYSRTARLAGGGLPGAAAGGATAAYGDVVGNAATQSLGEAAFAKDPRFTSSGEVLNDLATAVPAGVAFGMGGQLLGDLAGAGLRRIRQGEFGGAIKRAEEGGGGTSVLSGGKLSPETRAIEASALARGKDPLDELLNDVLDPMAAQALKEQGDVFGKMKADEAGLMGSREAKKPRTTAPLVKQIRDEIGNLHDPQGRPAPLAGKERKELGALASELMEVRLVPKADAARTVRGMGGGGKQMNPTQVGELLDQVPEFAEAVRRAQADALDPAAKAAAKPKRQRKAKPMPGPEDIAGAPTERDAGASTQRDTMLPPPDQGGTMRSPPFRAPNEKAPDVQIGSGDRTDGVLLDETKTIHAVEEVPGHVYVIGPRKMDLKVLDGFIERMSALADKSEGFQPYRRILKSAMDTRDQFGKAGQRAVRKGDLVLEGASGAKAEREMAIKAMREKRAAAGLPERDLKPRGEYADAAGPAPQPDLSHGERQQFANQARGYGDAGRGKADDALVDYAERAGVGAELRRIGEYKNVQKLKKAANIRMAIGSRLSLSGYTSEPTSAIALRAEPVLKALAQEPISPDLFMFLKMRGNRKGLRDVGGARIPFNQSKASLRGLGRAGAAGGAEADRYTIGDLSPEEQRLLLRLIELSEGKAPRRAASGE